VVTRAYRAVLLAAGLGWASGCTSLWGIDQPHVIGDDGGTVSDSPSSSDAPSSAEGGDGGEALPPPLPPGIATGKTYYVSPNGNDSNAGTSTSVPWKTLDKVTSTTFMPGDSVLLQGGATFTGCPAFSGSNIQSTAAAPFTLGSYGTGRFMLTANCSGSQVAGITISSINGFLLRDGILQGNGGGAQYGVWINNPSTTAMADWVRVQGCDISGFYTSSASDYGAEVFVTGYPGNGLNHVTIYDNTLHGASGPTSPDDNGVTGYGSGANILNCLYQGNMVYDIGGKADGAGGVEGNGIVATATEDCVVQYNVAHDLGANTNTCGGPVGIWAYSSDHATLQYNEVYNVGPTSGSVGMGCGWDGFSLAEGVTNSVVQYNYAHDNFGGGIVTSADMNPWGPGTIRYNVLQNNDTSGMGDYGEIVLSSTASNMYRVDVYNNTVFNDDGSSLLNFNQGTFLGGIIANNIFFATGPADGNGQTVVMQDNGETPTWATIDGNDWHTPTSGTAVWATNGTTYTSFGAYQSGTGWEKKSVATDPDLAAPGTGIACNSPDGTQACPKQYVLGSGSPMAGTGLDLTRAPYSLAGVGATDYYLRPIPSGNGTGYDVGAY
jgi:hypothetical protein